MRILFMGTASFAVPSLEALAGSGHEVVGVVTQLDRPHGRGRQTGWSPVKTCAEALGLSVLQPERASRPEALELYRALKPDLIVVAAYGQILRTPVLMLPPLGCVNVHGSLLPELRGAAPIQYAVIRGLRKTGVTTMYMDEGVDTGDIILADSCEIGPHETAGELTARLAEIGARLLLQSLNQIEAGTAPRTRQDSSLATLAPMLSKEDGRVDWSHAAPAVEHRIHGCNPAPGAFTLRGGSPLKLWRARAVEAAAGVAGTVVSVEPLRVSCGSDVLELLEVQPESRGKLAGEDYCRGYRVVPGERWG